MKWIQWVLLKIQSGHDSVHRRTDGQTDGRTDGQGDTSIPLFQLRWSGGYNNAYQWRCSTIMNNAYQWRSKNCNIAQDYQHKKKTYTDPAARYWVLILPFYIIEIESEELWWDRAALMTRFVKDSTHMSSWMFLMDPVKQRPSSCCAGFSSKINKLTMFFTFLYLFRYSKQ